MRHSFYKVNGVILVVCYESDEWCSLWQFAHKRTHLSNSILSLFQLPLVRWAGLNSLVEESTLKCFSKEQKY